MNKTHIIFLTFFTVNESALVNGTDFIDKFNADMTRYSLYYVYIGAAVFVSSYIQVSRKHTHTVYLSINPPVFQYTAFCTDV